MIERLLGESYDAFRDAFAAGCEAVRRPAHVRPF